MIKEKLPESKDSAPPKSWGTLDWKLPSGVDRKQAQLVCRAYALMMGDAQDLAQRLRISSLAATEYLERETAIPKSVGWKIPRLMDEMNALDAKKTKKALEAAKQDERFRRRIDNVFTNTDVNEDAALKVAKLFCAERFRRDMSTVDVGAATGLNANKIAKIERIGATPKSEGFFPLCKFYGLDPTKFGFVGSYSRIINSHLGKEQRKQRAEERKENK